MRRFQTQTPAIIRLSQLAGITGVCLIVGLSLIPGSYRPHTGAPGGFEHFFAYGLTAVALALGWRSLAQRVLIIVGLFVLACELELAQLVVPGRSSDLGTALVSGLGGVCGVLLATGLWRYCLPQTVANCADKSRARSRVNLAIGQRPPTPRVRSGRSVD